MALVNRTTAAKMVGTSISVFNALVHNYPNIKFPISAGTEKNKNSTTYLYHDHEILTWYDAARAHQRATRDLGRNKPHTTMDIKLAKVFLASPIADKRIKPKQFKTFGASTRVHVPERNDYYTPRAVDLYKSGGQHRLALEQTRY